MDTQVERCITRRHATITSMSVSKRQRHESSPMWSHAARTFCSCSFSLQNRSLSRCQTSSRCSSLPLPFPRPFLLASMAAMYFTKPWCNPAWSVGVVKQMSISPLMLGPDARLRSESQKQRGVGKRACEVWTICHVITRCSHGLCELRTVYMRRAHITTAHITRA